MSAVVVSVHMLGAGSDPAGYYLSRQANCPADYYLGAEPAGRWLGNGAAAAGLSGRIDPAGAQTLRALLAGRSGDGHTWSPSWSGRTRAAGCRPSRWSRRSGTGGTAGGAAAPPVRADPGTGPPTRGSRRGWTGTAAAGLRPCPRPAPASWPRRPGLDVRTVYRGPDGTDRYAAALKFAGRRVDVRRPGIDVTISAPKSVSVLFGLGDPTVAAAVRTAHQVAVGEALGYLESVAGHGLRGHQGDGQRAAHIGTDGWIVAAFEHHTSRAGDPQLHTHLVVPNLLRGADGKWSAVDSKAVYRNALTASYVYHVVLRAQLTERLGITWTAPVKGIAEVAGLPGDLLGTFSTRRRQILDGTARGRYVRAGRRPGRVPGHPARQARCGSGADAARAVGRSWLAPPDTTPRTSSRTSSASRGAPRHAADRTARDAPARPIGAHGAGHRVRPPRPAAGHCAKRCRPERRWTGRRSSPPPTRSWQSRDAVRLATRTADGPRWSTTELLGVEQSALRLADELRALPARAVSPMSSSNRPRPGASLSEEQQAMVTALAGADRAGGGDRAGRRREDRRPRRRGEDLDGAGPAGHRGGRRRGDGAPARARDRRHVDVADPAAQPGPTRGPRDRAAGRAAHRRGGGRRRDLDGRHPHPRRAAGPHPRRGRHAGPGRGPGAAARDRCRRPVHRPGPASRHRRPDRQPPADARSGSAQRWATCAPATPTPPSTPTSATAASTPPPADELPGRIVDDYLRLTDRPRSADRVAGRDRDAVVMLAVRRVDVTVLNDARARPAGRRRPARPGRRHRRCGRPGAGVPGR